MAQSKIGPTWTRVGMVGWVKRAVGSNIFRDYRDEVASVSSRLWGKEAPPHFFETMVAAQLFKDLKGIGYDQLFHNIEWTFVTSTHSLRHNIQLIRHRGKNWAKYHIRRGTIEDWQETAASARIDRARFERACLWIDSSDFQTYKRKGLGPKHPEWSYKLNAPGLRFTVISDANGKIVELIGGYSPKVYDADIIKIRKDIFEEHYTNVGFMADGHYRSLKKEFPGITWYVPFPSPTKKQDAQDLATQVLSKERKAYNKAQRNLRARAEHPFAIIKKKWTALSQSFQEGDEQLDAIVWIAFGVYNFSK